MLVGWQFRRGRRVCAQHQHSPPQRGLEAKRWNSMPDHSSKHRGNMNLDKHIWGTPARRNLRSRATPTLGCRPWRSHATTTLGATECRLGQSPRIPTPLTELTEVDDLPLVAKSAALFDAGPRRAEQIRSSANRALFELDSDEDVHSAMAGRVRPVRGPFEARPARVPLAHPTNNISRCLQGALGQRGPCIVLALGRPSAHVS